VHGRIEVGAGLDPGARQLVANLVPRPAELARHDAQAHVLLRRDVAPLHLLEAQSRQLAELLLVQPHQALALLDVRVEHAERADAHERVDLAHAGVEADELAVVVAGVGVAAPVAHALRDLVAG
jgi:hypothetical protein